MSKFSYSKLNTYKTCPFKFYLQYEQGHYIHTDNIAVNFGSLIHETEEAIAHTIQNKQPINYVELKNNLIKRLAILQHDFKADYFKVDTKSDRTYNDKAYEYLDYSIYNLEKFMCEHPTYEIVGIEQKFNFNFDADHSFSGAIDRVFYDCAADQYYIQDIKTWAVPAESAELTTPLQFVVYTLAAKTLWNAVPEQVNCSYYLPLVKGGLEQVAGTKGFMTRGNKKINSLFEQIAQQDFTPKPSCLCNYCDFCKTNPDATDEGKFLCPYYSLWERTTRQKSDIGKHENEWQGLELHPIILEAFQKKYMLNAKL